MTTRLPNFLIVGAPKAGTTSLYAWLKQHPSVFLSAVKEPCYFINDYRGGFHDWDQYTRLFESAHDEQAIGEASTAYLAAPESPAWIKSKLGEIRIIISLRNPVDRAWSMYSWMVMEGFEDIQSFGAALEAERRREQSSRFKTSNPEYWRDYLYFSGGLYVSQVCRFIDTFDRVHIIVFDDLVRNPADVFAKLCHFLEIDSSIRPNFSAENRSRFPRSTRTQYTLRAMRDLARNLPIGRQSLTCALELLMRLNIEAGEQRQLDRPNAASLRARYRDEVVRLSSVLGRDLSYWVA
jgi:sulfotransferase family protein